MMKAPEEFLDLNYPRELNIFKQFLSKRKEIIVDDLQLISENFGVSIEVLQKIKNEIRYILGDENTEYFSTTIHLRPRAIDYLKLGYQRINQGIEKNKSIFHYPVCYQSFNNERPDLIYLGSYNFSLCEIIPELSKKKRTFSASLDFHNSLMKYLSKANWEDDLRENLEKFLKREFSNFESASVNNLSKHIISVLISILKDYKNFIDQIELIRNIDRFFEITSRLSELFLNYFDQLKPILEIFNITKDDLENFKEKMFFSISSDFVWLICILGNLIHIGAEYGKLNEKRKQIGLKELPEPIKPQERFRFFEIGIEKKAESDTLRFLFGKNVDPFIFSAKYEGLSQSTWSPLDKETRTRIRIIDFYLKQKKIFSQIDKIFQEILLSREEFVDILNSLDYFSYLNEEEKEIVQDALSKLSSEKRANFFEWNNEYFLLVENKIKDKELVKKGKFKINFKIFSRKLSVFIFNNYLQGNFRLIKEKLPKDISVYFIEDFLIERIKEKELNEFFYGIQLPIQIEDLSKEDLIKISELFQMAQVES